MRDRMSIAAVILGALALRLYGIGWGLPDVLHNYSYHPDEFLAVGAAASIIQTALPRFYNYPSLYLYISALVIFIAAWTGLAATTAATFLCARLVTAAMGIGTVAITYWAGRVIFGGSAGLIAAVVLCIAPIHVQHSHFATVDVPSTLFVAAAIGYAGRILKGGGKRDYVLGGIMAGLAAGTKYNAGLVLLAPIAAHFFRPSAGASRAAGRWLLLIVGCALGAFVVSTPGLILQWSNFRYGFTYEMEHAALGHGLVFAGTGNGFIYTFATSLWWGMGPGLAVLFAVAAVYGLWKRDPRVLMVLCFVIPYYALISLSHVRFVRYTLPLFPAAALLIGWLALNVWDRIRRSRAPRIGWVWAGACGIVFIATFAYTLALDGLFTQPDPRSRAARWIFANAPRGSAIGFIDTPWFYSPPLSPNFGFGSPDERRRNAGETPYGVVVFSDCAKPGCWAKRGRMPDLIAISDYEVCDALRLRGSREISPDNRRDVDRIVSDFQLVKKSYRPVRRFSDRLSIFGLQLARAQDLPHDMRYQSPTITIYARRK